MILDTLPNILRANPQYLQLLSAYVLREQQERATQEEFAGWLSRVNSVEGIEDERMSSVHGKLICLGLLKFELGDRLEGIKYQISEDARAALRQIDSLSSENDHRG